MKTINVADFPIGSTVRITASQYSLADKLGSVGTVIKPSRDFAGGQHVCVQFDPALDIHGYADNCWVFTDDGRDGLIEPFVEQSSSNDPVISEASPTIDKVLAFLTSGKTLTQGEALLLGFGTRLASHIDRLRKRGHKINMVLKRDINGRSYGEYSLATRDRFGTLKKAA